MRRKSKTKNSMYAVLGILALGPQTGYDIKKVMERSTGFFWNENYGQIYPQLNRLLQNKDVTMHIEKQEGKPDRKVYTITEQGKQRLTQWLCEPMEYSVAEKKNELLLRLFFGLHVPLEVNIRHLEEYKNKLQEMLFNLEGIEESLKRMCSDEDENLIYWQLTINYGKTQAKAMIEWCEESINRLNVH